MRKKLYYIMLLLLLVIPMKVSAVKVNYEQKAVCFDVNTGAMTKVANVQAPKCTKYTTFKYFNIGGKNVEAYCAQLSKMIFNTNYSAASNWDKTGKNALIAGKCIELAENKFTDENERYLYTNELINYVFKYNGYYDFVTKNAELKKIYDEASNFVTKTIKYSGTEGSKLPTIKLVSEGGNDMNSTSTTGTYLSNKITLSGLVENYGGGNGTNTGDTTYVITATADEGTAVICENSAGTSNCEASKSFHPTAATKDFYVRVTNGVAGGNVSISVKGSNKSTYPTVSRYNSSSSSQILMIKGNVSFNRNVSTNLNLNLPDETKHIVKVIKVDEEGNHLTGSELSLFQANKGDDSNTQVGNTLATNSNGKYYLSWSTTRSDDNDTFFNYKYCVKETKAPKGFVLGSVSCFTPDQNTNKSLCVNNNGDEVEDDYCRSSYKCLDGGEPSEDKKLCVKTSTSDATKTCSTGTLNDDGKCAVLSEDPVNSVCPDHDHNATLNETGDKCYILSEPSLSCTTGTLNENGKCVTTTSSDADCVNSNNEKVDNKFCSNPTEYMSIVQKGGNLTITKTNSKSSVSISKKGATGEEEVPGAVLRICSNKPDKDGNCDVVKLKQSGLSCSTSSDDVDATEVSGSGKCVNNSDGSRTIELKWTSTDVPRTWTGLETGVTYYLVEDTPPRGYIPITTSIDFTIQSDGSVKTGTKDVPDHLVVVNNQLTDVSISKQDIATSKEIPGAKLSICESYTDENGKLGMSVDDTGECTPVTLANGDLATWTSGNEPHHVVGLPVGTYYLVEKIAPNGYSTAEAIVFMLKSDGTLADKNGKSLKDKKIVMYDKPINGVATGNFGLYVVFGVLAVSIGFGVNSYLKLKKRNNVI